MEIRNKYYIEQIAQCDDIEELNQLLQYYIEDAKFSFPTELGKVQAYANTVFDSDPVLMAFKARFKQLGVSRKV